MVGVQDMKICTGKAISPGYAQGRAEILGAGRADTIETTIIPDQIDTELKRFRAAVERSYRELEQLQARVQSELGTDSADIFSAHLLFLKDPQFTDRVEDCIRKDLLSTETAIQVTIDELVQILNEADNTYLRERVADIHDLRRRLLRQIVQPGSRQLEKLEPDTILVARELLPSDLLEFDREHLIGIVTETGGETGHAAILARALGIPAVTGIANATQFIAPGLPLLVDGQSGEVVLEPETQRLQASIASKARYDRETNNAVDAEECECATRDRIEVHLFANIGRPFEISQVAEHHLKGIGLFRTEYLFLDEPVAPSFKRQHEIYCKVAAALDGLPLVIRTLDLGGDKWPAFLKPRFEANPNLGVRGLRYSLMAAEDHFRTQIRAMLNAATAHDVRIMLPMVLGRADLQHAIDIIEDIASEEGTGSLPRIGALIETPSAVFAIDEILTSCDFISIGTNDLTQFMLAADRNALALIDDYTVLHPSVLRAVQQVLEAAHTAGKSATVCGEAAADPRVACLLAGLGARRFSMSPVSAARVRFALRNSSMSSLAELARTALKSDSPQTVSALATELLNSIYPELRSDFISV